MFFTFLLFYLFTIVLFLPSVDDTLEVSALQRSTADEATVDIGLGKEFRSIAGLAGATVEDGSVIGYSLTVLLSDDAADIGMDFLSLLGSGGLTGTDGPDGLVGDDNLTEVFLREVENTSLKFCLYHFVLFAGFALSQTLTNAEDDLQVVFLGEQYFLLQDFGSLLVVFAAL